MVLSQYNSFSIAQQFGLKKKKKEEEDCEFVSVSVLSCSKLLKCPRESRYESTVSKDVQVWASLLEWQFLIHCHGVQLTAVGCL